MKNESLRSHFPCFQKGNGLQNIVYFDSAATTQKPDVVLEAIQSFYLESNANVHRASYELASQATAQFENVRGTVQRFINANSANEIIWTKGATEGINLVASCLERFLVASQPDSPRGRILISATEHHANIVPWQQLAKKHNYAIDIIPINEAGIWDLPAALERVTKHTKVVAIGLVSNALGNINPIEKIIEKAKTVGAITLVDGAQAVSHISVDMKSLDCDFFVFSGHKAFAPTGIGVLYGRENLLEQLPVYLVGGEMVESVDYTDSTFRSLPFKYEAGTPNIEGVIALGTAIEFIQTNRQNIESQEANLNLHLRAALKRIVDVQILGDQINNIATISFLVKGINSQDLGLFLGESNIAVRVGHHCAMPLMKTLGFEGTIRVSLSCYNTIEEIDRFESVLVSAISQLSETIEYSRNELEDGLISGKYTLGIAVSNAIGWDGKYREIMLAGKQLSRLTGEFKNENNLIAGCESDLWLECRVLPDSRFYLYADSPSKVIRGLIALLIEPIQGQKTVFVLNFDFKAYLINIGLQKHLSESRGNGLNQAIKKIKEYAHKDSN